MREHFQNVYDVAHRAMGQGLDAVTQREFQEEVVARLAQVTEILVAQHAQIEGLRKRVEALQRVT